METDIGLVLDILKSMEIFADLEYQPLYELSQLFVEKIYNEGETIFEEDSIGTTMMVITSGKVRISQRPDPQTEEALIMLKKGDVFGEMALLEEMPRSATAIAHTNVIILEIRREDFLNFVEVHPKYGIKILLRLSKILSSRLRETDLKLKAFVTLSKWN
jgi:CRP/FNR family cyclic AMP-dependent transcriptional regulator